MKRILTIQDISCLGKCSLTVALPIISACGVEASILPTAVLSTHTMFKNFTLKYGEPSYLNPSKSEWKNSSVILSLEKPLTVKYLDVKVFNTLQESSEQATSTEEYLRKKFLESF